MIDTTDKLLVEGVEALEKYLNDHEVASLKMKKGFLMLTKAKLRLPEHALTEISYHEEFEASRVVMLNSEGMWRLRDASNASLQKIEKNKVRNRRAGKDHDPARTSTTPARVHMDTLMWFSSLPPSDLRQAQKQFITGLQALLVAAASAHEVQKAVSGIASMP